MIVKASSFIWIIRIITIYIVTIVHPITTNILELKSTFDNKKNQKLKFTIIISPGSIQLQYTIIVLCTHDGSNVFIPKGPKSIFLTLLKAVQAFCVENNSGAWNDKKGGHELSERHVIKSSRQLQGS